MSFLTVLFERAYFLAQLSAIGIWFTLIFVISLAKFKKKNEKSAFIVVLGDLGRSPRMNYHTLSLVKMGLDVVQIGYKENKQLDEVENNPKVRIAPLRAFPDYLQLGPQVVQYFLKTLYLSIGLFFTLIIQPNIPNFILVQNPPSIPTLGVVYVYAWLTGSKFVIDWHNYGFTILALKSGPNHILVKICRKFEAFFGRKADANLCVTDAMQRDLRTHFKVEAVTMHDKAHDRFRELNLDEKHDFYIKLARHYKLPLFADTDSLEPESTCFTRTTVSGVEYKPDRPALIVSSSSWTEDEDFHLLIDALELYQKEISEGKPKRNIICALTGKGPLKEYYEELFKQKAFKNIKVVFLWLEPSDYPLLLGSADLGICFHKSSSNLDLPMKVVDMFGTRLPVCAVEFSCISELVRENQNGLLFTTGKQLASHFLNLLNEETLGGPGSQLATFRENLRLFSNWTEEWESNVKELIENL